MPWCLGGSSPLFCRLSLWTGAPRAHGATTTLVLLMEELQCRGGRQGSVQGCVSQAGRVSPAGQGAGEICTHLALGPAGRITQAQSQVKRTVRLGLRQEASTETPNMFPPKIPVITVKTHKNEKCVVQNKGFRASTSHRASTERLLYAGAMPVQLTENALSTFSTLSGNFWEHLPCAGAGSALGVQRKDRRQCSVSHRAGAPVQGLRSWGRGTSRKHSLPGSPSSHLPHGWSGRKLLVAETALLNNM